MPAKPKLIERERTGAAVAVAQLASSHTYAKIQALQEVYETDILS
jgi:hypothetical protein